MVVIARRALRTGDAGGPAVGGKLAWAAIAAHRSYHHNGAEKQAGTQSDDEKQENDQGMPEPGTCFP